MSTVNKTLAIVFVFVVLSSLMVCTVKPVDAQKPPQPSVPKFSVKLVSLPYDVPPTTTNTFDPDTWKETTTTVPGYRVENKSIEITIKNQPFTPYRIQTSERDYDVRIDHIVEVKSHFDNEQSWKEISGYSDAQFTSQYTVLICSRRDFVFTGWDINDLPVGYQLDFRVKARIGCWAVLTQMDYYYGLREPYLVEAELSNWSDTQTITITNGSSSSTSSQTVPPQNPTIPPNNDQQQTLEHEQNQLPDFMFNPSFLLSIGALAGVGVTIAVVLVFARRYTATNKLAS
ncbi:MAG: hypothetical protein FWD52_07435 [Candidatus Bathyarchaeota archaeon]|nr:hypothetical protein [Candidatus Termiticorpusculum sp.]